MVLAWVCLIGTIGYVLRGQVAFFYAKYFLGGDAKMQAAFVTTGIVGNILSMVASTWITKKFCKIQLFRWSQLITFALSVIMFLAVKPSDLGAAFVLYFLINFIVDLQGPVFWSIISEAVDYGEVRSGNRVTGMAFGGISWCQKMGMSLAGGMGGWLLTFFQYAAPRNGVDQVQSVFTLNGIALMLSVIPGVFHLAMGLLMYRYFITDKYYDEKIRHLVIHEGVPSAREATTA
jgi:GPH family glycoside/pentoside/hexuronide:cation symporter